MRATARRHLQFAWYSQGTTTLESPWHGTDEWSRWEKSCFDSTRLAVNSGRDALSNRRHSQDCDECRHAEALQNNAEQHSDVRLQ
jgi:hypothetical protein